MKRYISALLALFCVLAAMPALAAQDSTSGFTTVVGGATRPVTRLKNDLLILGDQTIAGNDYIVGGLTVTGGTTLTTPLTSANIQTGSAKRELLCVPLRGLAVQALDDSTVFSALVAPGRAGIIKRISIAAITPPVGGVNAVSVLKNSATATTAAPFDPTGLVANVAQFPALAALANITLVTTDTIEVRWTTGVQTTDAIGPTVIIEFEPTDF